MAETALYASCLVADLFVGVRVEAVQEVTGGSDLTPVPLASRFVNGLLNLRGQIVTAIDLRRCLQLDERPAGQRPVNVILRTEDGCVSLQVDEVGDVLAVDDDGFEEPPRTMRAGLRELIAGAYKLDGRLLLALDVDGVLAVAAGDRM